MLTDKNIHTLKLGLLQLKDDLEPPAVKIVERVENNLDAMVASHKALITALELLIGALSRTNGNDTLAVKLAKKNARASIASAR